MILALFLRLGPGYLFCELLGAGIIIAAGILMWLVRRDQSRDNQAMQKFLDAERTTGRYPHCVRCGYDLTGDACPECGAGVASNLYPPDTSSSMSHGPR